MNLTHKITRTIRPTAPFHFDATFHKPAHFASGDNEWEPGVRWQTFRFLGKNLGVVKGGLMNWHYGKKTGIPK